jgi:hypothetical protein
MIDAKEISFCKNCDYKTQNNTTMLKHILNKHSIKEEINLNIIVNYVILGFFRKKQWNLTKILKHINYILKNN